MNPFDDNNISNNNAKVIAEAKEKKQETIECAKGALQELREIQDQGRCITETLDNQNEKLRGIDGKTHELKEGIRKAKKNALKITNRNIFRRLDPKIDELKEAIGNTNKKLRKAASKHIGLSRNSSSSSSISSNNKTDKPTFKRRGPRPGGKMATRGSFPAPRPNQEAHMDDDSSGKNSGPPLTEDDRRGLAELEDDRELDITLDEISECLDACRQTAGTMEEQVKQQNRLLNKCASTTKDNNEKLEKMNNNVLNWEKRQSRWGKRIIEVCEGVEGLRTPK